MDEITLHNAKWDDVPPPPWLEKIDMDQLEKLAAVGYSAEKIAMYFLVKKVEFMYYFMLEDSLLRYHFDRGILYHQAKEGIKLIDSAESNATQAQRLDKLRDTQNFRNAIDEIVYGGI